MFPPARIPFAACYPDGRGPSSRSIAVSHPTLVRAVRSTPAFSGVLKALPGRGGVTHVQGLPGATPALLVAGLREVAPARIWVLLGADPEAAEQAAADVEVLLGEEAAVHYPQRESLPYEDSEPHVEIGARRVEAVEAVLSGRASVLVTTPRAVQELAPVPAEVRDLRLEIRAGEERRPADLAERLESMGFERVPTVEEVGQFALRGGIMDVFGVGSAEPARLEFWGDEIESIRRFDVLSQRSTESVDELVLLPVDFRGSARSNGPRPEELRERRSILDLLPPDTVVIQLPDTEVGEALTHGWKEIERLHRAEKERGRQPEAPERLFLPPEAVLDRLHACSRLVLHRDEEEVESGDYGVVRTGFEPPEPIDRDLARLGTLLREPPLPGEATTVLCDNQGQLERLDELLADMRIAGKVTLAIGALSGGFRLPQAEPPLRVLTDHEIFRRTRRIRRRRRFRGGAALESISALKPGEYVVHMDHGIGRFREMERVRLGTEEFETLVIEYANGEVLRVPVHRVDLIERWVDDSEGRTPPKVHRIGGKQWTRTRRKTEQAIEEMTAELLELYAAREAARGYAFGEDTRWQREMESSFLFEDTPDQRQATEDVKADMESERPMDRLVCGDVGFGKTEVAIRAAFKAVQDGKQVAVLVPTTILSEQHLLTFSQRLADFPVRIEAISRFRTAKEQREVLGRLAAGEVDIVVGTHRLLSKDVRFRDLGLIIVDEEQRFGVRHKERLKQLRATVDVLTLTATPIPRTLQFSLFGLRDMTLIETAPRDRQPIITHVLPWSDAIIEDAIRRELDRGGQVFFVHNRIETISTVARRVGDVVPDARIGIAHGQMPERELEKVMRAFMEGELDILLATSIIENGLDVPRANTLIVNRADHFGLAQLYQIRGRVGRSHHRAYCYLLVPDDIPEDAEKRLRILEHYTELGSGHRIALKDLELRGGGNILGSAQSGFVHAVGFDTYTRLLEETVRRIRAGEGEIERPETEVSVEGTALIPEEYVADEAQKLHFYRRLSRLESRAELEGLREELRDRFGPLPPEVRTLLDTTALRLLGSDLGIERLLVGGWETRLTFHPNVVPRMADLQRSLGEAQLEVLVRRTNPLSLELRRAGTEPMVHTLVRALDTLASHLSKAA